MPNYCAYRMNHTAHIIGAEMFVTEDKTEQVRRLDCDKQTERMRPLQ